ncbi:MAG TPA: carboxylesterase family protein [Vicinamibacterales bacterium]|jgi:para-nitrobenzyl esterase|nr:carboxylesterase family protein [Vicinamibacterales bacterium]
MKRLVLATIIVSVCAGLAARAVDPTATVAQGVLVGTTDNGVAAFLGVPFAAPPVGDLRWAPPRPAAKWSEPRQAKAFAPACTQTLAAGGRAQWTSEYMSPDAPGVSEDCLYLNIWTPAALTGASRPAANLPVLFWIYGGGFNEGSGAVPVYNGANLAKKGLIVVNVNYRVGGLGFMAHPELTAEQGGASGNYGIQDQIAGLQWVRDNIRAFGGDPAKVTIAGQSAGAMSVQALLVSPLANGLFRGAIVQSAAAPGTGNYTPRASAEQAAVAALERAGVHSIAEARKLPAAQAYAAGRGGLVADGRVIPEGTSHPMASDVPIMIGYTLNDLFVSRARATAESWKAEVAERYGDRATDFLKFYPGATDEEAARSAQREAVDRAFNLRILDWASTRGSKQPVYTYLFTHVEPGPESARYGAFHTSEVPYEFDTLHLSPGRDFTDVDRRLAAAFSTYVANFVKSGDPNSGSLPRWPAMTRENEALMDLGDRVALSRAVPAGADAIIAAGKPPVPPARGGGAGR